jgi:hypothetical protein
MPPVLTFDASSGSLHLRGDHEEILLLPWPALKAMRRSGPRAPWRPARPTFDVRARAVEPEVARYLEGVPPGVVETVERFPDRHWELLIFVARCSVPALDLLQANPALGYMLANNRDFRRVHRTEPMVSARLLLAPRRRQRDVLEWLGFPPTERARRIVRKIRQDALHVPALRALREHLADPRCQQLLSHLPRITRLVLTMAGSGTLPMLAPVLLRQLVDGTLPRASGLPRLVSDTARMWRMGHSDGPLPVFVTVRRLREEHDRLAATTDWSAIAGPATVLPTPPLRGTPSIVPLERPDLIIEEGKQQRNCVGSYVGRVRRGRLYVYRVLAPTRATLSIVRRDGRWGIDQLEAAANEPVPCATREAVLEWLRDAQPSRPRLARRRPTGLPFHDPRTQRR